MVKILVTGGLGFIGSCFIRHVLNKYPDYRIINLDALTYCGNPENLTDVQENANYRFVHGSICDRNVVFDLVKECDWVVNFAAETHVDNSIKEPLIFEKTNVYGTLNLLQCCREVGIEKFLQISTDEVYGSLGSTGYFYENSNLSPNSPYSASKASADMFTRAYYNTYNLPVIITRCSNNYGPYQFPEKLIPLSVMNLLNGSKIHLYGDGLNVRDWLYVYDHCEAIDKVLHCGKIGEVYNIGAHNEKTNLEIIKSILNIMGKDESNIEYVEDRLGHDRRYAMSNDKIVTELGWKPQVSFEDGLRITVEWYIKNKDYVNKVLLKNR